MSKLSILAATRNWAMGRLVYVFSNLITLTKSAGFSKEERQIMSDCANRLSNLHKNRKATWNKMKTKIN